MSTFVSVHVLGKQGKIKKSQPLRDSLTHCVLMQPSLIEWSREGERLLVSMVAICLVSRIDCVVERQGWRWWKKR